MQDTNLINDELARSGTEGLPNISVETSGMENTVKQGDISIGDQDLD